MSSPSLQKWRHRCLLGLGLTILDLSTISHVFYQLSEHTIGSFLPWCVSQATSFLSNFHFPNEASFLHPRLIPKLPVISALSRDSSLFFAQCWINLPKIPFSSCHGPADGLKCHPLAYWIKSKFCSSTFKALLQKALLFSNFSPTTCWRKHASVKTACLRSSACVLFSFPFTFFSLSSSAESFHPSLLKQKSPTPRRTPLLHKTFLDNWLPSDNFWHFTSPLELATDVLHQWFFLKRLLRRNMECQLFVYSYYH